MRTALFLLLASCATTPPGGARTLRKEVVVPAVPEAVWEAWTTSEGARAFFAPEAAIEARPGGAFELWFDPAQEPGLRGSEGCKVLEAEAPAHLAFTWNFPPSIPSVRGERTRVDVLLTPEAGGTRVTLSQTGWRDGPDWDKGWAYFDRAWGVVLERLARRFTEGPADWSRD